MYMSMQKLEVSNFARAQASLQISKRLPALDSSDLEQPTTLKMVFVTASPVLTNEVKKYYSNLKEQLKLYVSKKEEIREA